MHSKVLFHKRSASNTSVQSLLDHSEEEVRRSQVKKQQQFLNNSFVQGNQPKGLYDDNNDINDINGNSCTNDTNDDNDDCRSTASTETYCFTDSERSALTLPSPPRSKDSSDELSRPSLHRSVSFASVSVREFNLTVGDHPDCSQGPPVTLDWEYTENPNVSLDEYETERPDRVALARSYMERRKLLHYEFGVPVSQLKASEKRVQRTRKEREESLKDGGKMKARVESAVWSFGRKLRGFSKSSSSSSRR